MPPLAAACIIPYITRGRHQIIKGIHFIRAAGTETKTKIDTVILGLV
jgi:hypothetical protein